MAERRREVVDLLTTFLSQLGQAGPYGAEFVALYTSLVRKDHWRYYLVCHGLLPRLADLIDVIDLLPFLFDPFPFIPATLVPFQRSRLTV